METNKINYITIQQYLDGSLDKEAMHELEKQALEDPFLADAIEGYSHINKPATKHLSLLQTQLQERIAKQQENKNVFSFSWQRLSVAAAAGLLFVTASILFWIKGQKAEEQLASNPKQVEVSLTSKDSIPSDASNQEQALASPIPPAPSPSEKRIVTSKENLKQPALKEKPLKKEALNTNASNASETLEEVTIVGYGAQRKQSVTGSVSTIMQGKVAGVSATRNQNITGKIVSTAGEPLPGVSVRLKNKGIATVTNVDGVFELNDSVGGNLTISYIGFDSKEIKAKPGDYLTVALDEDNKSLNEVVVVGYSKQLNEYPEPVIGWNKYKEYLQNSIPANKDLPSGRVVITFKVNPDGELSDFKIKKGLDDVRNQEAIRLIKEGPAWNIGKQTEARVRVRFK